ALAAYRGRRDARCSALDPKLRARRERRLDRNPLHLRGLERRRPPEARLARRHPCRRDRARHGHGPHPAGSRARRRVVVQGSTSVALAVAGAAVAPRPLDPARLGDHIDRLYRAAWALCGSREDAEDLVQETYARVLARPRMLQREDDLGYLLRALRNTFLNQRRDSARRVQSVQLPDQLDLVEDTR